MQKIKNDQLYKELSQILTDIYNLMAQIGEIEINIQTLNKAKEELFKKIENKYQEQLETLKKHNIDTTKQINLDPKTKEIIIS